MKLPLLQQLIEVQGRPDGSDKDLKNLSYREVIDAFTHSENTWLSEQNESLIREAGHAKLLSFSKVEKDNAKNRERYCYEFAWQDDEEDVFCISEIYVYVAGRSHLGVILIGADLGPVPIEQYELEELNEVKKYFKRLRSINNYSG